MQNKLTSLLLGTVIVLSVGIFGVYSYFDGEVSTTLNSQTASSFMIGHLSMTVTGPDGNVKQYVQTDNFILPTGEDCVIKKLFIGNGQTGSLVSDVCPNNVGTFNKIVLLTGGSCAPASTHTTLTEGACTLEGGGNGLDPVAVTINDGNTFPAAGDTEPHIDIDNNFSPSATVTITAAAVTNSTSTTASLHEVFAKADVSPDVTVNAGDTLTVQWDIEIGGTATFN